MSTANNNEDAQACVNDDCQFHGSANTGGYCSVCWKTVMSSKQQDLLAETDKSAEKDAEEEEAKAEVKADSDATMKDAVEGTAAAAGADGDDTKEPAPRKVQKKRTRCWECRKKVGLTGYECKCGYVFCGSHRYADEHNCDYDHVAEDRAHLAAMNEKIEHKKVDVL